MSESPNPDPVVEAPEDKGYPEGTHLADMTDAQKAAYYKDQNKHTDRLRSQLSAFNGFTPDDVHAMWTRLEELEGERLTADQKAVKEATERAAAEARAAVEAEFRPRLDQSALRSAAAGFLNGEQLELFVATTNPAAFYGENGGVDTEKVTTYLSSLFGQKPGPQPRPAWGQHTGVPPQAVPGAAGKAEALRRQGITPNS